MGLKDVDFSLVSNKTWAKYFFLGVGTQQPQQKRLEPTPLMMSLTKNLKRKT